jgi:hypothetical protein
MALWSSPAVIALLWREEVDGGGMKFKADIVVGEVVGGEAVRPERRIEERRLGAMEEDMEGDSDGMLAETARWTGGGGWKDLRC